MKKKLMLFGVFIWILIGIGILYRFVILERINVEMEGIKEVIVRNIITGSQELCVPGRGCFSNPPEKPKVTATANPVPLPKVHVFDPDALPAATNAVSSDRPKIVDPFDNSNEPKTPPNMFVPSAFSQADGSIIVKVKGKIKSSNPNLYDGVAVSFPGNTDANKILEVMGKLVPGASIAFQPRFPPLPPGAHLDNLKFAIPPPPFDKEGLWGIGDIFDQINPEYKIERKK